MSAFEVLTKSNSARITINDNRGEAPTVTWIIGRSPMAIAYAIMSYSKMYNINAARVGYSVVYDDTKEEV